MDLIRRRAPSSSVAVIVSLAVALALVLAFAVERTGASEATSRRPATGRSPGWSSSAVAGNHGPVMATKAAAPLEDHLEELCRLLPPDVPKPAFCRPPSGA